MCLVKSKVSKEVLLQGRLRDGLYAFDNVAIRQVTHTGPITFHSHYNNFDFFFQLCYKRLGHPTNKVVHNVLRICNIFYAVNKGTSVCRSCCMGKSK